MIVLVQIHDMATKRSFNLDMASRDARLLYDDEFLGQRQRKSYTRQRTAYL
jgi:hypothetical protein